MLIEPVRVEVEPEEGDDLVEALSLRGLQSRLLRSGERVEVEISPPSENWELWNFEVVAALEGWLEEAQREWVVARTETRSYTVRAPRPLAGTPASTRVPRPEAAEEPESTQSTADQTVTAQLPVLPAFQPPVGAVGVADPAARVRSRPVVVAAAVAAVLLATVGIAALAVVLMQVL